MFTRKVGSTSTLFLVIVLFLVPMLGHSQNNLPKPHLAASLITLVEQDDDVDPSTPHITRLLEIDPMTGRQIRVIREFGTSSRPVGTIVKYKRNGANLWSYCASNCPGPSAISGGSTILLSLNIDTGREQAATITMSSGSLEQADSFVGLGYRQSSGQVLALVDNDITQAGTNSDRILLIDPVTGVSSTGASLSEDLFNVEEAVHSELGGFFFALVRESNFIDLRLVAVNIATGSVLTITNYDNSNFPTNVAFDKDTGLIYALFIGSANPGYAFGELLFNTSLINFPTGDIFSGSGQDLQFGFYTFFSEPTGIAPPFNIELIDIANSTRVSTPLDPNLNIVNIHQAQLR